MQQVSQDPGSLTRGFQGSIHPRAVFSPTIQGEIMGSLTSAALTIRTGKIPMAPVWIEGLSPMVWVIGQLGLEMVLDRAAGETAME